MGEEELESRFVYRCPKDWFEDCISFMHDVIIYYSTGERISQRRVEKKTCLSQEKGVLFFNNKLWPMIRTRSIEKVSDIHPNAIIETIIHRKIIRFDENGREAIEQQETKWGVRYYYIAEVEYTDVTHRREQEMKMIDRLQHECFLQFDDFQMQEMFSCVGVKVQAWNRFNENMQYKWAFKWDGIKCKFVINSTTAYMWPDLQDVKMYNATKDMNNLKHVLWNAEFLSDQRLVLFDALAIKYDGNLYFFDVGTSIELLDFYNVILENVIKLDTVDIQFQKFYNKLYTDSLGNIFKGFPMWSDQQDGIIIFQNNKLIKWKTPTIDMKCIAPNKFSVAGKTITIDYPNAKVGKVYEFSPSPKGLRLIRLRNDRIASSNQNELDVYQEACSMMPGQIIESLK